ncbi:hypothetical protein ACFW2Y_17355 [Streptomyces sp. NPDC058877]|uniref:hypothetical protein n=1 Tax=unclassified Streptomyces TaxID=2593676 RepID=UPI003680BC50
MERHKISDRARDSPSQTPSSPHAGLDMQVPTDLDACGPSRTVKGAFGVAEA